MIEIDCMHLQQPSPRKIETEVVAAATAATAEDDYPKTMIETRAKIPT